ncbi:UNVERIFIED_CONTAM: hypothetical protein HDU68_001893 [Siphonaria sp. JEL0065]|nr:hypothetical protein HDU68_001893 [Siphonaria sp. JEL0065]
MADSLVSAWLTASDQKEPELGSQSKWPPQRKRNVAILTAVVTFLMIVALSVGIVFSRMNASDISPTALPASNINDQSSIATTRTAATVQTSILNLASQISVRTAPTSVSITSLQATTLSSQTAKISSLTTDAIQQAPSSPVQNQQDSITQAPSPIQPTPSPVAVQPPTTEQATSPAVPSLTQNPIQAQTQVAPPVQAPPPPAPNANVDPCSQINTIINRYGTSNSPQDAVSLHNEIRAFVAQVRGTQIPSLSWSEELAKQAQADAEYSTTHSNCQSGAYAHNPANLLSLNLSKFNLANGIGKSISWLSFTFAIGQFVNYDLGGGAECVNWFANGGVGGSLNSHFQSVVDSRYQLLGCAMTRCPGYEMVVTCDYN